MAIANIAAAAAAGGSTSAPARDVAEESGGDEFSGAIAAAETVAAQAGQKPVAGIPQQQEGETKVAQAGGVQAQATGRIDRAIPQQAGGSSENASLIQKMAVSSNTGVDIAGLKPWSPDWVFEGGMNRNPAQKTLIGDQAGGGSADASEGLEQLLRQSGAIMADSPDERIATAPGLPGSASMKGVAARTLGGDDFISVRQASAPRGQVPSAIGAQPAIQVPSAGTTLPTAIEPVVEGRSAKAKLPDTLGLVNPHESGTGQKAGVLPFPAMADAVRMDGAVVPGSMGRTRLDSESVGGIAQSIRQLGSGGEVRIRLKPDHLGEISLRVSTGGRAGSEVGLQIHASDERARKILEESLGSLRESLATQNLSLAHVDVRVAEQPSGSAQTGADSGGDRPGLAGQQQFSSNSGDGSRRNSGGDGASGAEAGTSRAPAKAASRSATAFGGGGGTRAMASNRLDVIA